MKFATQNVLMIVFPNCKINLGLHVLNKRSDGYHAIETVFYPINWCDALEVIPHNDQNQRFLYSQSGLSIAGALEDNLLHKVWLRIDAEKKLPPIKLHLHKTIPMGAGLGGGSSDAAFFIQLLNTYFELKYSAEELEKIASSFGSDCAFFLKNKPSLASGTGNVIKDISTNLSSYYILLVYPSIHSGTAEAYAGLTLKSPENRLEKTILNTKLPQWRNVLMNDFEDSIFSKHPIIKVIKEELYQAGALYASMSGSGSAVYGIFEKEPTISFSEGFLWYVQKPII